MPNNVSGRRMIDDPLDVAAREPGACGDDGLSDREPVDLRISPIHAFKRAMRWPYSSQTATLTFTLSCRAFAIAAFTIESASARVSVTTRNGFPQGQGSGSSIAGQGPASQQKRPLMSALGQKRTSPVHQAMSALPPKADIEQTCGNVRLVP